MNLRSPMHAKSWGVFSLSVLLVLVAIVFYPMLGGTFEWLLHRNVSYRGVQISMPFGWMYNHSQTPVTVSKPGPSIFSVVQSDLWMRKTDVITTDRSALAVKWNDFHSNARGWSDSPSIETSYKDGQRVSLLCRHQVLNKGGQPVFEEDCLSEDKSWAFDFIGRRSDRGEAEMIMRTALLRNQAEH